jgi:hypothetical protein
MVREIVAGSHSKADFVINGLEFSDVVSEVFVTY